MSRRGLLAGGAMLLAGCGKDEADVPPPKPVTALLRQLAAEHAMYGALLGLRPRDELIRRLTARSRERTRRLSTAIAAEHGRLYDAPLREEPTDDPRVALERARAAVAAHVAALPDLAGRERRRLGAGLIAESAADLALLGDRYGAPATDPFPGTTA